MTLMAVLDPVGRARVLAQWMRDLDLPLSGLTKPDLAAAVAATDDWIEANQSSYNTALPQPFRGTASLALKTLLFCYVAMRRAGKLRAEED
ncbi:hypothetical protein SMD44_00898 [Streptomyces alboflavus]|uniref:Uncharacterized protein n=1 Tax=Streptomyces alboflavus TaxID=67267 RepID=A0A1Z1W522_9ACTN|nr:hypothetical protein [Streptomyces alboflavus]ARX81500.1 hypothetical protein SMD44_00898 [Streptomyces alboflavus]